MMLQTKSILNTVLAVSLLAAPMLALAPKTPRPLADVALDMPGAKRLNLREAAAKGKIIAIFSSTCKHCLDTAITMSKVERASRGKGVLFYGAVANEGDTKTIAAFRAKANASFPIGTVSEDTIRRLGDYGIGDRPFVPIVLFVDAKNTVLFQFHGNEAFLANNTETGLRNMVDVLVQKSK